MAKNPKPLNIAVDESLMETTEVQAWIKKGHNVTSVNLDFDVYFGPRAWRMNDSLLTLCGEAAIKAIRAVKFPKKEKLSEE